MSADRADLVDLAATRAEVEAGVSVVRWLTANRRGVRLARRIFRSAWTEEERKFLEMNLYRISLPELAAALGRSEAALKVKKVRWCLAPPSKRPGILTGNRTARALGVDIHSIMTLHQRGLMPFEVMPGERGILLISRLRLYMWAVNPMHWVYFKVERMGDARLQQLVMLARSRWDDEWLRIGQAARLIGVDLQLLNNRIRKGKVPGLRWGNWWVRRSEIEHLVIHTGQGRKGVSRLFTPAADAYVIRAKANGDTYAAIGARMKIDPESVRNRWLLYLRDRMEK